MLYTRILTRVNSLTKVVINLHCSNLRAYYLPTSSFHYGANVATYQESIWKNKNRLLKPQVNIQLAYLEDALHSSETISSKDWDILASNVIERGNIVNVHNFSGIVMGFCHKRKLLSMGISYLEHLKTKDQGPNIATLSKFLRLCYECWPECKESEIVKAYHLLKSKLDVMDANTAESVIVGLSVTHLWREGISLLEAVKLTCIPGKSAFTALIEAAFRNGEEETGWALAKETLNCKKKPKPQAYKTWLKHCNPKGGEVLLNFFSETNLVPFAETAKDLENFMAKSAQPLWKGKFTNVKRSGLCENCGEYLSPIKLTTKQFDLLRTNFFQKVVLGKDVFTHSTPQEVDAFHDFLEHSEPYQVVVDGLNVAYSSGTMRPSPKVFAKLLCEVVEYFINRKTSVMVLGRKHMLKWPRQNMEYLQKNSQMFLAQNISEDDPLLLYAALHGGRDTYFVSRDLMRSQAFKLGDPKLMELFYRWQQWRQFSVSSSFVHERVNLRPPFSFMPTAQKRCKGESMTWHVPYCEDNDESTPDVLEAPRRWLCLQTISPLVIPS